MIYGKIGNLNSKRVTTQLYSLEESMVWPNSIHKKIEFGHFFGGLIYDPRLPYKLEDFYYLEKQKELLILMSGVIYNRNEIKEDLQIETLIIPDPELVMVAFLKWGEGFVEKLNGDFTIFIYLKKSNITFLYRDHLGIKPISYSITKEAVWFSSDSFGLCKALYANERVNSDLLIQYLIYFGLPPSNLIVDNFTLLPNEKVKTLLPGHYVKFSGYSALVTKYWFPENIRENSQLNFKQTISKIKYLIEDSVKIRCDKRFKAATHLSGGLDSGIVASLARKEYKEQKEFQGYCWTPADTKANMLEYDERVLVEKLGEYVGIKPIFTAVNTADYINYLCDWKVVSNLFYEHKVREYGIKNKVNLIFSGWGGDEFVSYGNNGIDSDLIFKFQWRSFFSRYSLKKSKKLAGALLYKVLLPALSLRHYARKKPLSSYSKYIKHELNTKTQTLNDFFRWRSRNEMHLKYLYQYHIPERTEDWNIHASRDGIEYRYPLIDKRVIEFVLTIPSRLLYKNGFSRILLREMSEGLLPEEVRWHVSKNDPVRIEALFELEDKLCIKLMDEVNEFSTNPEFSFIDFDLLLKDIDAYRNGLATKRPYKAFGILLFLKKVHEFTKAYYN